MWAETNRAARAGAGPGSVGDGQRVVVEPGDDLAAGVDQVDTGAGPECAGECVQGTADDRLGVVVVGTDLDSVVGGTDAGRHRGPLPDFGGIVGIGVDVQPPEPAAHLGDHVTAV